MFTTSDQMLQYPPRPIVMERRWKSSSVESAPNCPRCASSNTKFCYYNNYSLSQPRYYCKGCRRYWTKGGSLRNVPVGGGCRRNRRGKSVKVPLPTTASPPPPSNDQSFGNSNGDSSDIDLAVVFAKFLNQNSTSEAELVVPASDQTNINNNNVQLQEEFMMECQQQKPFMGEAELVLEGLPPQVFEDNPNANLGSLLGDEMAQEALWLSSSDHHGSSTLQNLTTWQPSMLQLQEFDSIIPSDHDDHLRNINSSSFPMMSDNWSSFDMSGLDVFLRP